MKSTEEIERRIETLNRIAKRFKTSYIESGLTDETEYRLYRRLYRIYEEKAKILEWVLK